MSPAELSKKVFASIDAFNSKEFASFFTKDGIFRFANMPPVVGSSDVETFVDNFFKSIKKISHSGLETWEVPGVIFVNGTVNYTRHNDTKLSVPFSVTWKMRDEKIHEYFIFVDNSQLYSA
jgi:hypothetical protein